MRDMSSPSAEISVNPGTGYPRRSDLRYSFVAKIEVTDSSGKQIVAVTSNLSRYGCHVPTTTPFLSGTSVKLRIKRDRTTFESEGKVVGLPPIEAIRAATITAADLMGWQGKVGSIEAGYYADAIANIAELEHVKFVMKGGVVVRSDFAIH
jgi:imidazolonepropionase-like amidohydrolase